MRITAIVLAAWILTGCVYEADYGKIERSDSGLFLEQLTVIREGDYQRDNFLHCVRRYRRYFIPQQKISARFCNTIAGEPCN